MSGIGILVPSLCPWGITPFPDLYSFFCTISPEIFHSVKCISGRWVNVHVQEYSKKGPEKNVRWGPGLLSDCVTAVMDEIRKKWPKTGTIIQLTYFDMWIKQLCTSSSFWTLRKREICKGKENIFRKKKYITAFEKCFLWWNLVKKWDCRQSLGSFHSSLHNLWEFKFTSPAGSVELD